MVDITFNAEKREKAGKGAARACRREGRVPAVIYGGKQEPVMISLHPVELEKLWIWLAFMMPKSKLSSTAKSIKSAARMFNSIRLAIVRFMSIS